MVFNFLAVNIKVQIEPFLCFTITCLGVCVCAWASTFLRSMKNKKEVKGEGSSASVGGSRSVQTVK